MRPRRPPRTWARAGVHDEPAHRSGVPGALCSSLRNECPASGYSLTSWGTPRLASAPFQLAGASGEEPVAPAVARDDRARPVEHGRVVEHAVVDDRGIPPGTTGEDEREGAAHAEPDHTHRPRAARVGPHLDVVERPASATPGRRRSGPGGEGYTGGREAGGQPGPPLPQRRAQRPTTSPRPTATPPPPNFVRGPPRAPPCAAPAGPRP